MMLPRILISFAIISILVMVFASCAKPRFEKFEVENNSPGKIKIKEASAALTQLLNQKSSINFKP